MFCGGVVWLEVVVVDGLVGIDVVFGVEFEIVFVEVYYYFLLVEC